jgi:tetratricopeptide (TPR) repeat protein
MSPEEHAQIQSRLIALGYFDESPDGEFGPLTRDAIKRFQMWSGEPVSDFLSPAQRGRLANAAPLSPPSGRVPDPSLPPPVERAGTAAEVESRCQSEDTNTRLAGCTEVISSKGRGYRVALADAYDGRCRSYNDLGRYQQAADDCNAAIRLNSNHPYAFNNLAAALDGLGDLERSISAYSRAIALKPSFIYPYLGRAHIFIKIGDKDRAKNDFDKALTIDPVNQTAKDGIASLQIETPALQDARYYLDDVQAFIAGQSPAPPSISQIAMAAAALQVAITRFDEKGTIDARLRLEALLNPMGGFEEFLKDRQDERDRIDAQRLATSMTQAARQLCFIDNYVKTHLLDAKNASLSRLRESINVAVTKRKNDELDKASESLQVFVKSNELSREYEIILRSCPTAPTLPPSFPRTPKTEVALGGSITDIVLLFNATPSAPSIVKDLAANFIFLTGKVSMCLAQNRMDETLSWFLDRKISRDGSVDVHHDSDPCDLSRLRTSIDIIVFQRGELLKQDPRYVAALLDLLETDSLRTYDIISEAASKDAIQRFEELSKRIGSEVNNNQRAGFGVLVVNDGKAPICLVSPDTIENAGLKGLLQGERLLISRHLGSEVNTTDSESLNTAFIDLSKKRCGYIAGSAGALKELSQALQREGGQPRFAAAWFSNEQVRQVGTSVLKELDEQRRTKQERNKMNEAARKQQETQRQVVELALRKQYGPRAIGLRDRIQSLIKQAADKPLGGTGRRARETEGTFPYFSGWLNNRFDDQWETTDVRSDVDDYGPVQWRGRNLEGIIVRTTLGQKNAIQGVRRTECFLFGFVEDVEFSMSRDLFDIDCDKSQNVVSTWKARRDFKSLWNAP